MVDEREFEEINQRCRSNSKRIDKLEEKTTEIHELTVSVKLMAQSVDRMSKELEAQSSRLTTLEMVPAQQWSSMKKTIFTSLTSTLAGGLVGAIVTMVIGG